MVNRHTFFAMAAAMLMLAAVVEPSFAAGNAADAGNTILGTLQDSITGSIGFFIGLAITILGLWTWIVKQETGAGIVMIIGGVLITLVPGIFNGMHDLASGVLTQFGGSTTTVQDVGR
ncbi:MAG: hypothetical protein GC129_01535 [Proteobacteria bacterium]|nr:hypothetical protein [Pseudomonadota bacterium]